jgi:hypothetical protein
MKFGVRPAALRIFGLRFVLNQQSGDRFTKWGQVHDDTRFIEGLASDCGTCGPK